MPTPGWSGPFWPTARRRTWPFWASHGSIQNLYCFSRLWEALGGAAGLFYLHHGDELAELLPRLGLEPALYAALDSYYQAGSRRIWRGWCSAPSTAASAGDYPLSPPSPPRGQGVYTLEGFPAAGEGGGVPGTDGRRGPGRSSVC